MTTSSSTTGCTSGVATPSTSKGWLSHGTPPSCRTRLASWGAYGCGTWGCTCSARAEEGSRDAMTTATEFRWLTDSEQRSWRAWLEARLLLQERLEQELKASDGITGAEYEVLVRLSEAPGRRLRMSELASR